MSKLVFRLEGIEGLENRVLGEGFYRVHDENGEPLYGNMREGFNDENRHPTPTEDSKLRPIWINMINASDWYFGFSSFEQLRRWFYDIDDLQVVKDHIVISVYSLHQREDGFTQSIFKKEHIIERLTTFPVDVSEEIILKFLGGIEYDR